MNNILEIRFDIKIAMHVLLVVDMQPIFAASNDAELLERVQELIRWSMINGCPIIFLKDYRQRSNNPKLDTHPSLLKLVRDYEYDRFVEVPKASANASWDVIDACRRIGYPTNNFIVCGVDTDTCVYKTVSGLSARKSNANITVVRNACRASKEELNNSEDLWNQFSEINNVSVRIAAAQ